MDTLHRDPKITMGQLGGIIGPRMEAAAVSAAAKLGEYPVRIMAGIKIEPTAAASEVAAP